MARIPRPLLHFSLRSERQTAIISCGTDNDYGHPAEQTLTNLTLAGVRDIRMTAESGTVALPLIAYKENAV